MTIYTEKVLKHNRPDITQVRKDTQDWSLIDIAVPADQNIIRTEEEKVEKYQDLAFEIRRIHGAPKVTVIPIVIGALGSISKRAKAWYDKLSVPEFIGSVQLSAILGTAHQVLCLWTAGNGWDIIKGAVSRPRMRVRSRNSLKDLASIFQSRREERIRNFIGKYLCHPWVVYSFDGCYKSSDCCRVFTWGFWLAFDVLCMNFRGCCDAVLCRSKPSRGGRRCESGRKRLYASVSEGEKFW